jgi:excisionase family DNA binding protein
MQRDVGMSNDGSGYGLLTARQVAELLGLCERTLFDLTKRGKLPVVRIGRAVRYDPMDVAAFIQASKTGEGAA